MSGIPPLPPLRVKEADGSPNVIPVFQITVSNMTLINNGGGKVTLDGAGGTGPAGPAGTFTIGSGITGGATDGFLLMVSNGATLGQVTSASFQRAIGFPVTTGSGGTGRITVGSAHTLLGVNSDGTTLSYYALLASDNATIIKSGTGIFISATTSAPNVTSTAGLVQSSRTISTTYPLSGGGNLSADRTFFMVTGAIGQILTTSGGVTGDIAWVNSSAGASGAVYAATGNNYAVLNFAADLTAEYRLVQSGNSITIDTTGNLIIINAVTNAAASSIVYAATGNTYIVTDLAGDLTGEFRLVQSGNSISITTASGLITINAVTGNLSTKQDSITYPLGINSGGTGLASVISATNLIGFSSSSTTQFDSYRLAASDNMTIIRSGTAYLFSATTGAGGGSGTINTGSANYLAYYPTSGTTIDDVPISVSTGAGIAPFNVAILTSAAASVVSGDFWFQSSSNKMYLAVRSSTTTYYVSMAS